MTTLATRPDVEPDALDTDSRGGSDPGDGSGGRHRLHEPGGRGGLIEVIRHRTVLYMLVRKDVRMKYRFSSIGWAWAFVKPTLQFCVYYFVIGIVLGLDRRVENFAVYVFSGLCLITFFNDAMNNGTRSIIKNRAIVKKIWLPRQIFPVAGAVVAISRFVPQFLILMVGATATGWYFTWEGLAAAIAGLAIIMVWGLALGVVLSGVNVYLREIGHVLELAGFVTHWLTPTVKPWIFVYDRMVEWGTIGAVIMWMYLWNPLCTAVELWHLAFWEPTVDFYFELSPNLWTRAWVFFAVGLLALAGAQWAFKRMQVRFAEEL